MRSLLPKTARKFLKGALHLKKSFQCSPQFRGFYPRFYSVVKNRTYDDAVDLLNTLQTSFKVLHERRAAGINIDIYANDELRKSLDIIGYTQRDLEKLNIVHVSGTKGKGSTCAYVDSILSRYQRSHSIQNIGLFTSPHLIAVRERIRINSVPIPKASFAKYFFEIWDALAASSQNFEKPVYFRYLTLLSYHVFLQENVNAAIYEVGVGGEYDATNIVDRPAVTGISSLGLDHTFQLGDTIDRIAWHKAGIQKVSCPSFTVPQAPAAMEVIEKLAKERKVESLQIVDLDDRLEGVQIKPDAPFQRLNASLAIALAETTLKNLDPKFQISKNSLPKEFINGLENVVWRGRCEKMVEGNVIWYIDGAHTTESIQYASKWFKDESSKREATRVLIFNQQGEREAVKLLESLHTAITASDLKFDHVIFCPTSSPSNLQSRRDFVNHTYDSIAIAGLTLQSAFAEKWRELDPSPATVVKVLPSVEEALGYVRDLKSGSRDNAEYNAKDSEKEIHALITGSVHLVGRTLGILEGVDAL